VHIIAQQYKITTAVYFTEISAVWFDW